MPLLQRIVAAAALVVAAAADPFRLELHLRPLHTDAEIEAAFVARSTPGSRLFRRHLTSPQLRRLVGAPQARVARVQSALRDFGATAVKVLAHDDVITAELPAGAVARLGLESAATSPEPFYKPVAVPRALAADVTIAIAARGTVKQLPSKPARRPRTGFPGAMQTPQSLMQRYKVPSGKATVPANYTQGVAEFYESYFRKSDLQTFSQRFNLPQPKTLVAGPNSPSQDDVEGTLDIQYLTAVSGAITTWWVSHNVYDYTQWAEELMALSPRPSVVSVSWAQGEFLYDGLGPLVAANNAAFRKLGLLGVSVVVASGDYGPGARGAITPCPIFLPNWPASSPYVTTVGATYAEAGGPEIAVEFSGGGFSTLMPMPQYQRAAVTAYLRNASALLPNAAYFNRSGRAYPDVAALGTNYEVFGPSPTNSSAPGAWYTDDGTSCATPTFAAVVSRINGERMAEGKPALGFLNPALYRLGKVGQDITQGHSVDTVCSPEKGFPAAVGWDAVTGLGSPDYEFLKANL